jgi:hypothetical protein
LIEKKHMTHELGETASLPLVDAFILGELEYAKAFGERAEIDSEAMITHANSLLHKWVVAGAERQQQTQASPQA